jgi:hypothetical protein
MRAQNGWPVVDRVKLDQGPFHGITFPNGILAGDVGIIARWQLRRYVADVEPLRAGQCWGWLVKKIDGGGSYSNHSAGCAWDINAQRHPMGRPPSASMTARQISACRVIVHDSGNVLRWGGDYTGRKDTMHWEVVGSVAAANRLATKILQRACNKVPDTGLNIHVDGVYGPATTDKVRRVQRHLRVEDDGVFGPATTRAAEAYI